MIQKRVPDPMDPAKIAKILPDWAAGKVSLKDIKGYSDDELYAIAHTAYFFLMQGKNQEAKTRGLTRSATGTSSGHGQRAAAHEKGQGPSPCDTT